MGSSSRGWKDTRESLGGVGRELWGARQGHSRAEGMGWGWSVCLAGLPWDGLGCRAEGAEGIGVLGQQEGSWLPLPQEKRWVAGCGLSACSLPLSSLSVPLCPLCVCVNSEFSPSPLFPPRGCLSAASFPHLCASLLPACASPGCLCSLCPHSLLSLCFFAIPLLSLCSLSAGSAVSLPLCLWSLCSLCLFALSLPRFALCPLCLCAFCISLFALQVSWLSLQPLFTSSCPGPRLLPLSRC